MRGRRICARRLKRCRATGAGQSCLPAGKASFRCSTCGCSRLGRLIDVSRLAELQYIVEEYGQLRIGALTTHNTILRSPVVAANCPIMTEAYAHVANHSIRNRGTLGGNLCHNDPAFEMPLVVTLLGATMSPVAPARHCTIAADSSFKAPFATDLAAEEMLVEVRVPRLPPGHGYSFLEISQRYGDRALVAAGCLLTIRYGTCRDVRIGFRNAVHNVFRVPAAEARLEGKPATAALIDETAELAARHRLSAEISTPTRPIAAT